MIGIQEKIAKLLALADRKPYAGVSDQDLVLVDQIILVRQTPAP